MPETKWLLYAENVPAPLCRKPGGSYMAEDDTRRASVIADHIDPLMAPEKLAEMAHQIGGWIILTVPKTVVSRTVCRTTDLPCPRNPCPRNARSVKIPVNFSMSWYSP
jgi:hypothetical protein